MKRMIFYCMTSILLYSCSSKYGTIYVQGSRFVFRLDSAGNNAADTLILTFPKTHSFFAKIFTGQNVMYWEYRQAGLKEKTGYIDNKKETFIHPPRKAYMEFTEIPPFPQVFYPLKIGNNTESKLHVESGFGKIDNFVINQKLIVRDKIFFHVLNEQLPVWVLEGENTNYIDKIGQYKVTYYFSEKYGFVFIKYEKPDGKNITLTLFKASSEGD